MHMYVQLYGVQISDTKSEKIENLTLSSVFNVCCLHGSTRLHKVAVQQCVHF